MNNKKFNPYNFAISIIKNQLSDIKQVTDKEDFVKIDNNTVNDHSIYNEGFNIEHFWNGLKRYQEKNVNIKRTKAQYSVGEILACPRNSFYHRKGMEIDQSLVSKYPHGQLKAILGHVIEQLSIQFYNETVNNEIVNSKNVFWDCRKKLSILYPIVGVIDGYLSNKNIILDFKFTESESNMHIDQVYFYSMLLYETKSILINRIEVVYVSNNLSYKKKSIQLTEIINNQIQFNSQTIDIFNQLKERIQYLDNCLKNNILPNEEKDKCGFCYYKKHCKGNINKPKEEKLKIKFNESYNKINFNL